MPTSDRIWTEEHAWTWYRSLPWLCGFNYVPSNAVNSTEMWQQESFSPGVIDREFSWAEDLGLNACRVFLQYLVWEADPIGLRERFDRLLESASRHGLHVLPILFDDCAFAGKEPYLGPQAPPVSGVHNSGWTPSPGRSRVLDRHAWPSLERYVVDVIGGFASDERVLAWDLYNEPGNDGMYAESLPLLEAAFGWARSARPSQPLTTAVWTSNLPDIDEVIRRESDVLSFHDYGDLSAVRTLVERLKTSGRPLLCTEWMRRGFGSHFDSHLPYFREEHIGCFFWGLVNGRTQTHFPWGSAGGSPAPDLWFQDLLTANGAPHRPAEISVLREQLSNAPRQDRGPRAGAKSSAA